MVNYGDFEYGILNEGAVIEKYNGQKSFVIIPEFIDGLEVVSIGAEAFRGHGEIKEVGFPKSLASVGNYAFCECRGLKAVNFGPKVNFAGDHCFYNCRAIERMELPSGLEYIGDGFVKNCEGLNDITISSDVGLSSSVASFLNELSGSFSLNIKDKGIRLLFPSFGYEYIDRSYAKVFETVTHGGGLLYRKCIEKGNINYSAYDWAFKRAQMEELPETMCQIAVNRLMNDIKLESGYKEIYRDYISANIESAVRASVFMEMLEAFDKMEDYGVFTADNISKAIETASELKRPDFTAALIDIRQRNFGARRKTFDL